MVAGQDQPLLEDDAWTDSKQRPAERSSRRVAALSPLHEAEYPGNGNLTLAWIAGRLAARSNGSENRRVRMTGNRIPVAPPHLRGTLSHRAGKRTEGR